MVKQREQKLASFERPIWSINLFSLSTQTIPTNQFDKMSNNKVATFKSRLKDYFKADGKFGCGFI